MSETSENNNLKAVFYAVRFKRERIDYFIDRSHNDYEFNDYVIVQAERGKDLGRIIRKVSEEYYHSKSDRRYPLEILKRANEEEIRKYWEIREEEKSCIEQCQQFIMYHGLEMKLVDAEMQYDSNKLTFFYTADQRVDFRELVKDLASTFRTRIELRQIGVRDEAKKLGGLAPCGRELCCSLWLDEFKPVSSQLARDQQLAVNPSKISGLCSRLMCCLNYEQEYYEKLHRDYPSVTDVVKTDIGTGTITSVDIIRDQIMIRFDGEDDPVMFSLSSMKKIKTSRKDFLEKWRVDR